MRTGAAVCGPYHLDEHLPGLSAALPEAVVVTVDSPDAGVPAVPLAVCRAVADEVAAGASVVLSGDCTTGLGVVAGLQRRGLDVGIVWFDAHGDFNTPATSPSGYLGGMPVAIAAGRGDHEAGSALGLRTVPETDIVLVGVRDLDPREADALAGSEVRTVEVTGLTAEVLPDRPLYLHVDLDVVDGGDVPGLRYPVVPGPTLDDVLAAVGRVADCGRVVAVGVAATWEPAEVPVETAQDVVRRVLAAAGR